MVTLRVKGEAPIVQVPQPGTARIDVGPQTLIFDGNVLPIHAPSMHENAFGPVFVKNIGGSNNYLVSYMKQQDPYDLVPGPQRWVARVVTIDPDALTLTSGPELVGADGTNPLGIVPFTSGKAVIAYTVDGVGFKLQMLHISGGTLTTAGAELDLDGAVTAEWPLAHVAIDSSGRNYLLETDAPTGLYFMYLPFGEEPDNYMYHLYVTQVGGGDDLTVFQQLRTVDYPDLPSIPRLVDTGGSHDRRLLTYAGQPPSSSTRVLKYVPVGLYRPDNHDLEVGTPVVVETDPAGSPFWEQWAVYKSAAGPIAVLVKITGFTSIGDVLTEYYVSRPTVTSSAISLGSLTLIPRVGDQTDYFSTTEQMFAPITCGFLMAKVVGHEDDPVHGKDVADREYSILDAFDQARTALVTDPTTSPYGYPRPPGSIPIDWYATASDGVSRVLVVTEDIHFPNPIADHAYFSITGQVLKTTCGAAVEVPPALTPEGSTVRIVTDDPVALKVQHEVVLVPLPSEGT